MAMATSFCSLAAGQRIFNPQGACKAAIAVKTANTMSARIFMSKNASCARSSCPELRRRRLFNFALRRHLARALAQEFFRRRQNGLDGKRDQAVAHVAAAAARIMERP